MGAATTSTGEPGPRPRRVRGRAKRTFDFKTRPCATERAARAATGRASAHSQQLLASISERAPDVSLGLGRGPRRVGHRAPTAVLGAASPFESARTKARVGELGHRGQVGSSLFRSCASSIIQLPDAGCCSVWGHQAGHVRAAAFPDPQLALGSAATAGLLRAIPTSTGLQATAVRASRTIGDVLTGATYGRTAGHPAQPAGFPWAFEWTCSARPNAAKSTTRAVRG